MPFEKTKLKVSATLHDFLTERFGDYMKIPSPERIKYEQHAESWSTTQDFKTVLGKNNMSFKDEARFI